MSKTIEEASGTSRITDAWNNASLVLSEGNLLLDVLTAIGALTTAIMLGGIWIVLFLIIAGVIFLVALGTVLRKKGFFYRILNALFDAQTKPLYVNQSDYLAVRIALFTRQTDEELLAKTQALEERLGIERTEPIHSNGAKLSGI